MRAQEVSGLSYSAISNILLFNSLLPSGFGIYCTSKHLLYMFFSISVERGAIFYTLPRLHETSDDGFRCPNRPRIYDGKPDNSKSHAQDDDGHGFPLLGVMCTSDARYCPTCNVYILPPRSPCHVPC